MLWRRSTLLSCNPSRCLRGNHAPAGENATLQSAASSAACQKRAETPAAQENVVLAVPWPHCIAAVPRCSMVARGSDQIERAGRETAHKGTTCGSANMNGPTIPLGEQRGRLLAGSAMPAWFSRGKVGNQLFRGTESKREPMLCRSSRQALLTVGLSILAGLRGHSGYAFPVAVLGRAFPAQGCPVQSLTGQPGGHSQHQVRGRATSLHGRRRSGPDPGAGGDPAAWARPGAAESEGRRGSGRRRRGGRGGGGRGGGRGAGAGSNEAVAERSRITVGARVVVVKKEHQRSGEETVGEVARLLTGAAYHPRGIKVMLSTGQVGRVRRFAAEEDGGYEMCHCRHFVISFPRGSSICFSCPTRGEHQHSPVRPRGIAITPLVHNYLHQSLCHDPRYYAAIQHYLLTSCRCAASCYQVV